MKLAARAGRGRLVVGSLLVVGALAAAVFTSWRAGCTPGIKERVEAGRRERRKDVEVAA
jgi:hypothetical protein